MPFEATKGAPSDHARAVVEAAGAGMGAAREIGWEISWLSELREAFMSADINGNGKLSGIRTAFEYTFMQPPIALR